MKKKNKSIRIMMIEDTVKLNKKGMNIIKGGYTATDDLWKWR